ncbi:hypothetical protein Tco_0081653, partial [Tanacetum coccineum]
NGNSVVFAPSPKPSDLMTIHSRTTKLEKQMFKRYKTEIKIKEKFKEDDLRMNRHELDVTAKYSKMKRIMPPKGMSAAAILKLVADEAAKALEADRAARTNPNVAGGSGGNGGQGGAPPVQECSFASFMKCCPTQFYGNKGAVELCRWFEKT